MTPYLFATSDHIHKLTLHTPEKNAYALHLCTGWVGEIHSTLCLWIVEMSPHQHSAYLFKAPSPILLHCCNIKSLLCFHSMIFPLPHLKVASLHQGKRQDSNQGPPDWQLSLLAMRYVVSCWSKAWQPSCPPPLSSWV